MELRFHRRVQGDLDAILEKYYQVSPELGDDFFAEFQIGVSKMRSHPKFFHFDASGLRRCNFDRFPYHLLYDLHEGAIRVWVLRHDHRRPGFGLRRFRR
ncbi:type II toxin-antitoxin system RelE/ParE family toxin [Luteolibacter arcticus]|uniref:Type II toxin-antitoxin system RelE/ParE family toxin n=1 Tax=Luteolibacter arcticus TaxID=1581411 RepID=A0ABT3GEM1_9BACT|nr:type II toxin-antitoxin system RelE/ParE family toxin [Luteolibacter arcticus]MCW1921738.1 type II toxin-antitoxin system RelE/ParE family toxin [Luteolibacter arcticus]